MARTEQGLNKDETLWSRVVCARCEILSDVGRLVAQSFQHLVLNFGSRRALAAVRSSPVLGAKLGVVCLSISLSSLKYK